MKTTLQSAIKAAKFDYVNSDIEAHFTHEKPRSAEYKLFSFDRNIESADVVKEIETGEWSPATLSELLIYAAHGWNGIDLVVALGSVARVSLDRYVPCLGGFGTHRKLFLGWWGTGWDRLIKHHNL